VSTAISVFSCTMYHLIGVKHILSLGSNVSSISSCMEENRSSRELVLKGKNSGVYLFVQPDTTTRNRESEAHTRAGGVAG
jgi:hypothetical protein